MLQIHSLMASASGTLLDGNFLILLGIALAACVLGIQVACIVILIKKLMQAGKDQDRLDGQENRDSYSEFGIMAMGASVLPMSAEGILGIAVALNALAALVFVILVGVVRSRGYDFAAFAKSKKKDITEEKEPEVKVPPRILRDGQNEESEEAQEFLPVEEPEAEGSDLPAVAAFAQADAASAPAVVTREVTTVVKGGDGQNPVRVVTIEKEYSETVRETVPGAPVGSVSNDQAQQLIAKIERLIDKLEGNSEEQKVHLANGIILAADEPVPADEDEEDDELDEDGIASDENGDDDDTDTEADESEHFTGNERIIGFDEETGYYIMAHYRKSFEAKLIQSRPNIKRYYSELKNALLAYNGTKSRISWAADSFHNGRTPIAKINVKTKILELYLALEPASLDGTVYRGQDVSHVKKYADTPFRYKIRSPRKFKWAMELVQRVCEEHGLSPIDIERVDYEATYPFEDTDSLVARGLIKEYIREEKPASTFELDESHVPSLADMDETVIPANANISWEFDNEVLAQKELEEESVEPPVQEEEPVAPTQETPVAPREPTVIRETTKTTQVRYTEQSFGESGEVTSYKEYFSEDGPFSADFFETEAEKNEEPEETEVDGSDVSAEIYEESTEDSAYEEYSDAAYETELPEETDAVYEDAYAESDVTEDEEDGDLDWSVPANVYAEDTVVIDVDGEPVEEYADADVYEGEEVYGEAYAEDGEVYYEDEQYEEQERYEEEPVEEEAPVQPKLNPDVALVDVGILDEHFQSGDQIDLEALKDKGLVLSTAKVLKIYKSGEITKSFTVVADHFTMDAIFAIDGAGGNIQMIKK